MKKFLLLFSIINSIAFGQQAEIISIRTDNRLFKGKIDDQHQITLYLESVSSSANIGYVKGLKGWYYYDTIGDPIALAGVQNQQTYLFTSSNKQFLADLINFEYKASAGIQRLDSHFDLEEISSAMTEATERFVLEIIDGQIKGRWYGKDKTLQVELRGSDMQLNSYNNFLKHGNKYFDLNTLLETDRAFLDIEAVSKNGQNFIINYEYQASLNYFGRCGGGTNSGKIALRFDNTGALIGYDKFSFVDCYMDRYIEETTKINNHVTQYVIRDYSSDVIFNITVNSEQGTLLIANKD